MRILLIVSLAALAATPLLAQKPPADDERDPARIAYRSQGIPLCVGELHTAEGITPDELETICGCAFDRLMPALATDALPPLGPGRLQSAMGRELLTCAVEQRPALGAAVARRLAQSASLPPPVVEPPAYSPPPPLPTDTTPAKPESERSALRVWLDSPSWPRWLTGTGLPRWAWLPIALLAFALLRALLGRRDSPRDLIGPPPSMRRGGAVPRRPDFPR